MKQFAQIEALQSLLKSWKQQGKKLAFVPTMGNLHEGHLSLVTLAKQHADKVVCSVFVNPLQFGPNEDFEQYPRTLAADAEQLQQMGCDVLFAPSVSEMYPEGALQTQVRAALNLANQLEGRQRPGHFDGVATVVAKLFHIVQPEVAIFGQKDFQQFRVIEQMVQDLNFPIQLVCAPIAREQTGLALSSRNQYLTAEQKAIAPVLYQTLQQLQQQLQALKGSFQALSDADLLAQVSDLLQAAEQRLLTAGFDQVDYIQLVNRVDLQPCTPQQLRQSGACVLLAVARLGRVRLLDNLLI